MKKILIIAAMPLFLGSCVIAMTHQTTGNPIGNKVGEITFRVRHDFDKGVSEAARAGNITKIGSVDTKYYSNGKIKVTVTGE